MANNVPTLLSTPNAATQSTPVAGGGVEKTVKSKLKNEFNKEGLMKAMRLKKPERHKQVQSSASCVPAPLKDKQHDCILCCRNCTDSGGLVKPRSEFHATVKQGHTPPAGFGRKGHKTSSLCMTCGFIPLCRKPRSYGPNAMSCWDLFHSCSGLFNGRAATMCDIKDPGVELSIDDKYMSKKKPKKFREAAVSAERPAKRARPVCLQVAKQRKTNRNRPRNAKRAEI